MSYADHPMDRPQIVVVGDLHLGPIAPVGADSALEELLGRYSGCDLLCLGDLFDLSADCSGQPAKGSVLSQLERHERLSRAWKRHLKSGSSMTLVVGNHDGLLGAAGIREAILEYLDLPETAPLSIAPWWVRCFDIHFEHGHVWDPDNAPIHPLVAADVDNEPLGVALTRRVLSPTGAYQFAHAHQTTPLAGLLRALRELQWRAPEVILRYFAVGAQLFWRAIGPGYAECLRDGRLTVARYAEAQGLPSSIVDQLLELRPTPRHADPAATFARLYFDRAAATLTTLISSAGYVARHDLGFLLVAAAGLLYLGGSAGDRAHRYSGSLLKRTETAALGLRPIVAARAVVFGHTHVATARLGYVNTGAFGFPTDRGRPYLVLHGARQISRGWFGDSAPELEPLDVLATTE